jgi:hypothetical protein
LVIPPFGMPLGLGMNGGTGGGKKKAAFYSSLF